MLRSERVELTDDDSPDVVATPVRRGQRDEELLERVLELAPVERGEGVGELSILLQTQAGGETVSLEAAADRSEDLERLIALAPRDQHPREPDGSVGPARLQLECSSQIVLLSLRDKQVCLRRQQAVKEALDRLPPL